MLCICHCRILINLDPPSDHEDFELVPVSAVTREQAAALQQNQFTSDVPNSITGDKDSCASLMPPTKLNRNHDLDETCLDISN